MKRLIIIFCVLSLTLGSCGIPSAEKDSRTESNSPIILVTVSPSIAHAPTNTPESPTITPAKILSDTPKVLFQPSATYQHPSETYDLPTLISGQPVTITQISMIDVTTGWAIGYQNSSGDRILFTQDSGYSWEQRTPPILGLSENNADQFQAWAYFHDENTAWVMYLLQNQPPPIHAPMVWRKSDGGQTWENSDPLPINGAESYFIPENFSFIDSNQGWLLVHIDAGMSHDYSNLYTTSDGGTTWHRLIDPYRDGLQSLHNTGLAFANPNLGWVTKNNLAVLPGTFIEQTLDGGQTWEDVFLPAPDEFDWFNEISQCATSNPIFLEASWGIVLVNCRTFDEKTFTYSYITADKGQSWQSARLPTSVQSLVFINHQNGWALGRDLYHSTDGGLSWVKIKTVNWDGQFSFIDQKNGWAVATADEAVALVTTQDGGLSWQLIPPTIK